MPTPDGDGGVVDTSGQVGQAVVLLMTDDMFGRCDFAVVYGNTAFVPSPDAQVRTPLAKTEGKQVSQQEDD
ncbi:hypothetical protein ColTof4_09852 [Colletotrichum tofieldiae]|nr:hypothetical protein ColTof3_05209 [Colletotrichum tofieldiae]GKT77429.1 hypothetical protein ColTof4_09852 [Colletotrichum tofieldiae]GKT86171.1 hypothetical protein Ct61P_04021 [Colletotrichum tofieldiae]